MKKSLYVLVLGIFTLVIAPSCSTSDSLDEVIQESEMDIVASTDDAEDKIAKPGAN